MIQVDGILSNMNFLQTDFVLVSDQFSFLYIQLKKLVGWDDKAPMKDINKNLGH